MIKSDQISERESERRRDLVLRAMLSTPPQPNWKPTNVRKKKRAKQASKS